MTAGTVTAGRGQAGPPSVGGMVPFTYGTNKYVEKMGAAASFTLGASQQDGGVAITPGGYLSQVYLLVRSTGGALGGGALSDDAPFSVIVSASIENTDGAPILYPMSGWAHTWRQYFSRPWTGHPLVKTDYSASPNPSFTLSLQPEIRHTAGVLTNTDTRSQFRLKYTVARLDQYIVGGAPTAPVVTVTAFMETYAQPEPTDLQGIPIQPRPPGCAISSICRHQTLNLVAAGADNPLQISLTGNEIRLAMMIFRTSANVRADLASDPIRWRLDARSLGVFSPDLQRVRNEQFYRTFGEFAGIPRGMLLWPRFFDTGNMVGEPWLSTTNATFLIWETATAAGGSGGSCEIVTDEVAPIDDIPLELESI